MMKRLATLFFASVLAMLGLTVFASSAQAVYPTPTLTLTLSTNTVVSGGTFTATATASINCDMLTVTWNGQSASVAGSTITHVFQAPTVTHDTVIQLTAVCTYTNVSGTSGGSISAATNQLTATANVTVVPRHAKKDKDDHAPGALPNTGGPNIAWYFAGGGAVLAGGLVMFASRRRHGDKAAS